MKCSNCGSDVPQGSAFCNHCGAKMAAAAAEIACPICGQMIPADSVFCPKCGKMVRDDMNTADATAGQQSYNELQRELEIERQRARENEERARRAQQELEQQRHSEWRRDDSDDDDDDMDEESREAASHFNRNVLIGIAAVALVVIVLSIMRGCGGSGNDAKNSLEGDSVAMSASNAVDPLTIFNAELARNNYTGDGATAVSAVKFAPEGDNPERIVGITLKSSNIDRTFYKIYILTPDGVNWTPTLAYTQYLDGRTASMDPNKLIVELGSVPRAVNVGGKNYLYFAYLSQPTGQSSLGRVTVALYDPNASNKRPKVVDYDGPFKGREDGRQYIYGKTLQSIGDDLSQWLDAEARKIKLLYFQTEEELKAEMEAKAKADSLKALADPERASEVWSQTNADNMEQMRQGKEVKSSQQAYDKPIFNMKDMDKKIENGGYIVFKLKNGSVYGFNKNSRKYFVI